MLVQQLRENSTGFSKGIARGVVQVSLHWKHDYYLWWCMGDGYLRIHAPQGLELGRTGLIERRSPDPTELLEVRLILRPSSVIVVCLYTALYLPCCCLKPTGVDPILCYATAYDPLLSRRVHMTERLRISCLALPQSCLLSYIHGYLGITSCPMLALTISTCSLQPLR